MRIAAQIERIRASLEAARHWRQYISLVLSTASSFPNTALACPDCAVGREARQRFLQQDFALYLVTLIIPFVLIAAISVWAERSARVKKVAHE